MDDEEQLLAAAYDGNLDKVRRLLNKGIDVNVADKWAGITALHLSSTQGHTEVSELLIKQGANINAKDMNKGTPLHEVSGKGYLHLAELLLDNWADANATNSTWRTPLYCAIVEGHMEIVETLLKGGADVNMFDKYGWTPLHSACENGRVNVVKILLENGAKVNATDKNGDTPLYHARLPKRAELARLLLDWGANVFAKNKQGKTPLMMAREITNNDVVVSLFEEAATRWQLLDAVKKGNLEEVQRLLNKGADVNAANENGHVPLHGASRWGHSDVAELLLKHGANVNATSNTGWSPLLQASQDGRLTMAKLLLESGADVNAADETGETPLHRASCFGRVNLAKLLLQNGAKLDAETSYNKRTPLHEASSNGRTGVVQLLLDWGADIFAKDKRGETPLILAKQHKNAEIVSLLWQSTVKGNPSLWSISYEQLMNVNKAASDKFKDSYPTMTMQDVNEQIIKPVCRKTGTSYALHLNKGGLKTNAFVTHSWDEPFAEFVESIRKVFVTSVTKPNLWICAFALVQGNREMVAQQLDVPIDKSPFVRALKAASLFVVVRNPVTDLYSRIWCVCELMYAMKLGLVPNKTHVTGPDVFSNSCTSVRDADASDPKDREKILKLLLTYYNCKKIDMLVQQFREHEFL